MLMLNFLDFIALILCKGIDLTSISQLMVTGIMPIGTVWEQGQPAAVFREGALGIFKQFLNFGS